MTIDLGRLRIEKLIVHEIPSKRSGCSSQLILSEVESPLIQEHKNFLREKIIGSLDLSAFNVAFSPNYSSPVPNIIFNNLVVQTGSFVSMSKEIALHLYNCQTGVNSAGLLTVVQALIGKNRAFAILKLEKEEGVRVKPDQFQGKATFSIEYLHDLMLTRKTKVFKVGLFIAGGNTPDSIRGKVSDEQRGYKSSIEVADFFLKKFLGCQLIEAPEIATKHFFKATEEFINNEVGEPVTKTRYEIALIATLNNQARTIHPKTFAEEHLDVNHRQKYIDYLKDSRMPIQEFDKNTNLIKQHLNRIRIEFESGLAVIGTPQAFGERVRICETDDGYTRVEIEDRLKKMSSK